jgi:hypothetical protein
MKSKDSNPKEPTPISVAFLMIWYIYLHLVQRTLVTWSWIQCLKLMACPTTADLSGSSRWMCQWCTYNLVSIEQPVWPVQAWPHPQEILSVPSVQGCPWLAEGNRFSLAGGQLIWCAWIAPCYCSWSPFPALGHEGRKATESGFSMGGAILTEGWEPCEFDDCCSCSAWKCPSNSSLASSSQRALTLYTNVESMACLDRL